eukprot:TRINITY_DN6973_c0_g1_i1.p1 TRINITY_DN6973_c0_g1~~TRINITY_DN6973_c0_g1_i1.p1  ORF type:complete len:154 (-),score=26.60 TRINITY_DN6973_c0_g1_i1:15-476(-)
MRSFLVAGVFFFGLFAVSCFADVTLTWNIGSHHDAPPTLVQTGSKVTWSSDDSAPHTVTFSSKDPSNAPEAKDSNEFTDSSYSITWVTPGTYSYFCDVHGAASMSGTVVVNGTASATSTPTSGDATTTSGASSDSLAPSVWLFIATFFIAYLF